jgi:hypothetical protein
MTKIHVPVRFINVDRYSSNIEAAKSHIKDLDPKILKGTTSSLVLFKFIYILQTHIYDTR